MLPDSFSEVRVTLIHDGMTGRADGVQCLRIAVGELLSGL